MWPLYIMVVLSLLVGAYQSMDESIQPDSFATGNATALAHNMVVYANTVATYVSAQNAGYTDPSADNSVPDSSLTFPSWYVRNPMWSNKVINGTVTIYASSRPNGQDISGAVCAKLNNYASCGVTNTTTLTILSPRIGNTGKSIPAGVPNNVPVIQQFIK